MRAVDVLPAIRSARFDLPLTYDAMRATFSKQIYTNFDGVTWLQLKVVWRGYTAYYMDTCYQDNDCCAPSPLFC